MEPWIRCCGNGNSDTEVNTNQKVKSKDCRDSAKVGNRRKASDTIDLEIDGESPSSIDVNGYMQTPIVGCSMIYFRKLDTNEMNPGRRATDDHD